MLIAPHVSSFLDVNAPLLSLRDMAPLVIFFMAHAGIAQMMAWVSWFLDAPAGSVAFRVFCPPSTLLAKPYFQRLPFFFKTTWGSAQFVYAIQEGYRSILAEFPDVSM
jgi:hypothetical protein